MTPVAATEDTDPLAATADNSDKAEVIISVYESVLDTSILLYCHPNYHSDNVKQSETVQEIMISIHTLTAFK